MRVFKLVVAYDGTGFHGWQRQPGRRTVQGVIEEALAAVLQAEVQIQGAGRTDAGVHARGQVASFEADSRLPARALPPLLGRRLPADVSIRSAAEEVPGFHARFSASARRYSYRLLREEDLLWSRFAWHPPRPADAAALERAAGALEGEHDFSAFRAAAAQAGTARCRVFRAGFRSWEAGLQFDIVANRFLYRMVRAVLGTALALTGERDPHRAMAAVIASRDRRAAGPTLPARGLCLEQVFYPGEVPA